MPMSKERQEYMANYRKTHRSEINAYKKKIYHERAEVRQVIKKSGQQWRKNNPEKCQAYQDKYRSKEETKQKMRARARKYHIDHAEEISIKRRTRYNHHPEVQKIRGALYYEAHKEALSISHSQWRKDNPDKIAGYVTKYRALKSMAPVCDLTGAQWREMKDAYGHCCVYCGRKMQRLTQDHITPLSSGGAHTLSNVVPACQSCNSKKHTGKVLTPIQPLLLTIAPNAQQHTRKIA